MTNHTPGPWEVRDDEIVAGFCRDMVIAIVRPVSPLPYDYHNDTQPEHSAEANARFIVTACNCHKVVVMALRQISTIMEGSKAQMENQIQFARSTAKQAIRIVEEQEGKKRV